MHYASANDQISPRVARRHVIDESNAFGVDFRGAIRFAQLREVLRAGLMDDLRSRCFADPLQRSRNPFVQRLCAQASADDEKPQRSRASGEAFGRFTAANIGRKTEMRLDGKVVMTPVFMFTLRMR